MWECDYAREAVDYRLLGLRLLKKIWILPVAAVLGAILFGAGYYGARMVLGGGRTYQAQSIYYMDFAKDYDNDTLYGYFNQYTWNELIHTDAFMDRTMELLDGQIDEAALEQAVSASIESDVRLLYTRCVTKDAALSLKIAKALEQAVVEFGQSQKEFAEIRVADAAKEAPDNSNIRTKNAVILGAFIGLFAALFAWLAATVADTSCYLPVTLERRYHIVSLGAPSMEEFEAACKRLLADAKVLYLVAGDTHYVMSQSPVPGIEARFVENPIASPKLPEELFDRQDAKVAVYVKAGAHNGKQVERTLEQLGRLGVTVDVMLLAEEDSWLIRAYYRK